MKNKIIKKITLPFIIFFISFSSFAADLNIAFFASSSENGYNQATWEGVKKAANEAGNVNAEIFNGEFNATLQYGQIEDIIASGKFDGFVVVPNDTVGIAGAIEKAKGVGLKVFTVGVGTPEGELIQMRDSQTGKLDFLKDGSGDVVKSRLNENFLRKISSDTGAFYLPMQGADTAERLYSSGLEKLTPGLVQNQKIKRFLKNQKN